MPGAEINKLPSRYKAVARWNSNRKLGQAVALEAMDEAIRLAMNMALAPLWCQLEAQAAAQSDKLGGLNFTAAEVDAFEQIAREAKHPFDRAVLRKVEL